MAIPVEVAERTQNRTTPRAPLPPNFDIPPNLERRTLKQIIREGGVVPEKTWGERADAVEVRVKKIIASQTHIVENVILNPPYTEKSDLFLEFKRLFPVRKAEVEVKSSSAGLRGYKDGIIKDIEENNGGQLIGLWARSLAIEQWLVDHNIVLVNGGEKDRRERTAREILDDSFYPQLERIVTKTQELRQKLGGLLRERHRSKRSLSPEEMPVPIFP